MSTYNENLQQDVSDILSNMQAEKLKLKSINQVSQYSLYHAQGANIVANEKLNKVVAEYDFTQLLDNQGVQNDNLATNLLATVTQASVNIASSVTNSSTAASNVQIAATAIAKLAADIGGAFNIVSAEDNNTEIYTMTRKANELIRTTAYNAELASQVAMEATTRTSEILINPLLAEATASKADIETLLAATEGEFEKLAKLRTADVKKADSSSIAEKHAEGTFKDSQTEFNALQYVYESTKCQLNYGLDVKVSSDNLIQVVFTEYNQPFQSVPFQIPPANPHYYGIAVKAKNASLFNIQKAELLFTEKKDDLFYDLKGDEVNEIALDKLDSDSQKIKAGSPYVFFLYLDISQQYKKFTNNFLDLISAPSDPFIPANTLICASEITAHDPSKGSTTKTTKSTTKDKKVISAEFSDSASTAIYFTVTGDINMDVEHRLMLLPLNPPTSHPFLTKDDIALPLKPPVCTQVMVKEGEALEKSKASEQKSKLSFYFDLAIAQTVSPANYIVSTPLLASDSSASDAVVYQAEITESVCDNFGSQLQPGQQYIPVVLSTTVSNNQRWIDVLSDINQTQAVKVTNNYQVI